MTAINNPYAAPGISKQPQRSGQKRRPLAFGLLLASTVFAVTWTFVNQFVLHSSIGPIPMFIVTSVAALFSSFVSRDPIVGPLACFIPILSASAIVGIYRDWSVLQFGTFACIACGFTLPSLILVALLDRRKHHRDVVLK